MPSRKRNKGRERKAKKADKIDDEIKAAYNTWRGWAQGFGEEKFERISNCDHGCDAISIPDYGLDHPVSSFMNAFIMLRKSSASGSWVSMINPHPPIWDDENYRNTTINILTRIGTNMLLSKDPAVDHRDAARIIVTLENYKESMDAISVILTRRVASKVRDLSGGNLRDLLKFYSKRTSCSCLKKMYSDARKTLPKVGYCGSCCEIKERALHSVCSRCRIEKYCSRECQVAHWPKHAEFCDSCVSIHLLQLEQKLERKQQTRKEDKDECVIS